MARQMFLLEQTQLDSSGQTSREIEQESSDSLEQIIDQAEEKEFDWDESDEADE